MNVFWRKDKLSEAETALLEAVDRAHQRSVFRGNLSSKAVIASFAGSLDYTKSIAAALMTLGDAHGPITQTAIFLQSPEAPTTAQYLLNKSMLVPGWGNSFHKGVPDPLWENVDFIIKNEFPIMHERLASVTEVLHEAGRNIFPNPSAYTAATAIIVGLPVEFAAYLFIAGRLAGWTQLLMRNK